MYIVKFKAREFSLVPSGVGYTPNVSANFLIDAQDISLGTIEELISDPSEIARITIIDQDKQEEVMIITGLPVVSHFEKIFDYVYVTYEEREEERTVIVPEIDPETGEPVIDPETGEPVTHEETIIVTVEVPVEHTTDVISLALAPAGLEEAVEKNSADIEYIAIMSDIEL